MSDYLWRGYSKRNLCRNIGNKSKDPGPDGVIMWKYPWLPMKTMKFWAGGPAKATRGRCFAIIAMRCKIWFAAVFLLAGGGLSLLAEDAPRVAVAVETPERGEAWQAALTAELSRQGIAVVEREELPGILSEQEIGSASRAIVAVEVFLHFRRVEANRWLIEKIDAGSGAMLDAVTFDAAGIDQAGAMAEEATKLIKASPAPSKPETPRVAVVEAGERDSRVFILAARLRDALRVSGFQVLDRALTQEVVNETAAGETGWRTGAADAALLGADAFVEVSSKGTECQIRVVETAGGRLAASRAFPFDGAHAINAIQPWLLPALGRPAAVSQPYLPTVEVEALEPFYRGLALFNEGQFARATGEFTQAYLLNDKFRDAMLWEARCYDRLGLAPLAAAMRRHGEIGLVGNGSSSTGRILPVEDVAFLGVSGDPSKLADTLSALSASALASLPEYNIHLPEHLERLRREFDWMAGTSHTRGMRWEDSGSLFCGMALRGILRRENGQTLIDWTLTDTVAGTVLSRRREVLDTDYGRWAAQTTNLLRGMLSEKSVPAGRENPAPALSGETVAELESRLLKSRGLEANVALVELALADPGNPLIGPKGFEKGQSKRDGLDAFLDFALRDWVISQLPESSPRRRWLELMRILSFDETEPVGRLVTGQKVNLAADLARFAAADPRDLPGLVARYAALFEDQDILPPDILRGRCKKLMRDLEEKKTVRFPNFAWLIKMTSALRDFAALAAGDATQAFPDPNRSDLPHRIRVKAREDGNFEIVGNSGWVTNEFDWVVCSPEEKILEARAALAINGRPGELRKVPDHWLSDYPRSLHMAAFVASALHELNRNHGRPLVHALDWESERAAFLRMVNYTGEALEFWIPKARDPEKLDWIENIVRTFLMSLNERVYLGVFTDGQYEGMRDRLAAVMDAANARFGRAGGASRQPHYLSWRTLTREQSRELRQDHLGKVGLNVYNREALLREIKSAEAALFAEADLAPLRWWQALRAKGVNNAFTAPEIAAFHRKHSRRILEAYSKRAPDGRELGFLLEQALALLNGGETGEAEPLFRLVLDAPEIGDRTETGALRANAAFRLAQIYRLQNRKPEAIEMARRGLRLCDSGSWLLIRRLYNERMEREVEARQVTGNLASHLTRFLTDMRMDYSRSSLPDRVGMVTVSTPNIDNPELKVFYRTPPRNVSEEASKPKRVLVLVPSINHGVLEYLQPGNPWAQFADTHGLVLVCPRFCVSGGSGRAAHAFTYYTAAQVWAGNALLEALDKISEGVPIEKKGLLFHSYGTGTGFACRIARWRPGLVSAVSSHGGGANLPWFAEVPGLQPLDALKDIRFFVTGGQDDDYAVDTQNRVACAEAFVTVLRGAGVTAIWRPFPGVGHFPTPEMESESRKFLAGQ